MPTSISDWIGTIITVVAFIAMAITFLKVFLPEGKSLEKNKHIPFEEK